MFDEFYEDIKYEQYVAESKSNTPHLLSPVIIKGLRLKGGKISVSHSDSGDTTTCSIVYKTKNKIPVHSKLNGREVVECVKLHTFGVYEAYLNYVR